MRKYPIVMRGNDRLSFTRQHKNQLNTLFVPLTTTLFTNAVNVFGSSYEAAFYGVWYSVVFSELLATLMTFAFFRKYKNVYHYA